jgi:hypothetical protein
MWPRTRAGSLAAADSLGEVALNNVMRGALIEALAGCARRVRSLYLSVRAGRSSQ